MNDLVKKNEARAPRNLERAMLMAAVVKELKQQAEDAKGEIHHALQNGESIKVTNTRGAEIGSVYRTNPKPKFVVEDMAAVLPVAMDEGREIIDLLPQDPGSVEYAQAVEVLQEHAPGLLRSHVEGADLRDMAKQVEEDWKVTGNLPAGWAIQEARDGYTAMKPNETGKKIVQNLLGETQVVLQLSGGDDGAE